MTANLFISYAWTSDAHRQWVWLLAAGLKAVGFNVLIDADVDYGDSLNGFMRAATDSRHVLLIVDENYVDRAGHMPESGVGIETAWFKVARPDKPATWLSVAFKDNPRHQLPAWLTDDNPKAFDFNADPATDNFPGSWQIEEVWRWIEDLPANRDHATTVATLRERARRLEVIDAARDPNTCASPALEGEVTFEYEKAPGMTYSLGFGEYAFTLAVSGCSANSVYVYKDPIHAVGINRSGASEIDDLAAQLTPGRTVTPRVGEQFILQNSHGTLCVIDLIAVQPEVTTPDYVPASIQFTYRILLDS